MQLNKKAGLTNTSRFLQGNCLRARVIWEEEVIFDTFWTLSTFVLGPGEALAMTVDLNMDSTTSP